MKDVGIGELSAFVSGTVLVLTILYVYGYSLELGVNLFLYFRFSDYLELAIEWLTPVLVVGLLGALLHKFLSRVEQGASEEEIAQANPKIGKFRRFADASLVAVCVLIAISNTYLYFTGRFPKAELYSFWAVGGFVLWIVVVNWYTKAPRLVASWGPKWHFAIMFLPALAILSFFFGLHSAASGSRLPGVPSTRVSLQAGREQIVTGHLVFALEDYVILKPDQSGRLLVLPKGEIRWIRYPQTDNGLP